MATAADNLAAEIASLETEYAAALKVPLKGGNQVTMSDPEAHCRMLERRIKHLHKRLMAMGYELDGEGNAVPAVGVSRAIGVVRHGRL